MQQSYKYLISGTGDLGLRFARNVLQISPLSSRDLICCETKSKNRHPHLLEQGYTCRISNEAPVTADSILICFPPSTESYLKEIERSLLQWNRKSQGIFVSSTSVYKSDLFGDITEDSALAAESLLGQAEAIASKAGLHIVRLAGLYTKETGPHIFWQKTKQSDSHPSGKINLIHREDAAQALAQLTLSEVGPDVWNFSDENPVSRLEIAQHWARLSGQEEVQFNPLAPLSSDRRILSKKIQRALHWKPTHKSFLELK